MANTSSDNMTARPRSSGPSITVKIALAFTVIGALAVMVTAGASYFLYAGILEKEASARLDSVRLLIQNGVDSEFNRLTQKTTALAESQILRTALVDPAATEAALKPLLASNLGNQDFSGIVLFDATGNPVASTKNTTETDTRNAATRAISERKAVFLRNNDSDFIVATPVTSADGHAAGAVVTTTPATLIYRNLQLPADTTGASIEAYLVDGNLAAQSPLHTGTLNQRIETNAVRNSLAGSSGSDSYTGYQGQTVLGSYGKLKNDAFAWALIVEQNKSDALAPARNASLYIALTGLATLLLVGAGAAAVARFFAQPIVALEQTMQRVSAGDEAARATVGANDEIGQLAESFNSMLSERNAVKDRIATENRRLQSNIQDFLLVVADASEGRLAGRAKKTEGILGNVADALNQMLANVSVLIGEAKRASSAVQQAADEISGSGQNLADGAIRQTEQISNAIQDVQDLAGEAQNVAEISRDTASAASRTRQAAEDGARSLNEAVSYMQRLQENVQVNARKITLLGQRSQEISGIVRSISDISAETDVLAMNASIEAARAGEQGKGFTIVADQVRALSDRTRQATVEIEKLVFSIQQETIEAVRQMENQTREVENGARQVASASQSLSNIVETSVDSSTLAEQIRESAKEQEKRAQTVLQAVLNINQISLEARNRTVEFRETSEQLALLAVELNKQLANFEIDAAAQG